MIRFTVLNARTCKIIRNADVEIWHCDAIGDYSAVNGAATRFLRGHQRSNAKGIAEFLTVFPGWYRGRTPHIHMKVSVGGNEVHTGQVFFNEAVTRTVYAGAPYASRGVYDTPHSAGHDLPAGRRLEGGAQAQAPHRRPQGARGDDRGRRRHLRPRAAAVLPAAAPREAQAVATAAPPVVAGCDSQ